MLLITISRQTGSQGNEIAELLSKKLDIPIITRAWALKEWLPEIANKHELHMLTESPSYYLNTSTDGITFAQYLEDKLIDYVSDQSAIIMGMGSQIILSNNPSALHVKIMASFDVRRKRIMKSHHLLEEDAERIIEITDRKHRRYINTIFKKDWSDPLLYHLTMNTDSLSIEQSASMLSYLVENLETIPRESKALEGENSKKPVVFQHPSEEEFAKILDMHGLEWEYEPRTFPIKWDAEGNIIQAFSPDFYLPKFDTYIELTTMNQKYTSVKKKKAELLKKLYPGTNINIVFKNDFHTLIERFGMMGGGGSK
ncbi:MAG: cytidylate kinase-like family protein [Clostridium sp.]|nr:cytidylate kinase-like family protein [Clostridium sp.]